MAIYTPVPAVVPSAQRSAEITSVATGDQVDLRDVLGRPARKVQFHMNNASETLQYRLNNLVRRRTQMSGPTDARTKVARALGSFDTTIHEIWSQADGRPVYEEVGEVLYETADGLEIDSVEIIDIDSAATITLIVW